MRLRALSLLVVAGTSLTGLRLAGVSCGVVRSSGGGGCRVWSLAVLVVLEVLCVAGCGPAAWYLRVAPL